MLPSNKIDQQCDNFTGPELMHKMLCRFRSGLSGWIGRSCMPHSRSLGLFDSRGLRIKTTGSRPRPDSYLEGMFLIKLVAALSNRVALYHFMHYSPAASADLLSCIACMQGKRFLSLTLQKMGDSFSFPSHQAMSGVGMRLRSPS